MAKNNCWHAPEMFSVHLNKLSGGWGYALPFPHPPPPPVAAHCVHLWSVNTEPSTLFSFYYSISALANHIIQSSAPSLHVCIIIVGFWMIMIIKYRSTHSRIQYNTQIYLWLHVTLIVLTLKARLVFMMPLTICHSVHPNHGENHSKTCHEANHPRHTSEL